MISFDHILAVSCFIIMTCATIFTIIAISYIQKNVPDDMVGKIIALSMAVAIAAGGCAAIFGHQMKQVLNIEVTYGDEM